MKLNKRASPYALWYLYPSKFLTPMVKVEATIRKILRLIKEGKIKLVRHVKKVTDKPIEAVKSNKYSALYFNRGNY